MKPASEVYEAKARQCEQEAEKITDADISKQMLDMAARWRELALEAEKSRW